MYSNDFKFWVTIVYFSFSLLVLAISILVPFILLRKLIKFYRNSKLIFGESTDVRLISLGLTTIYFYETLQQVYVAIFRVITSYFSDISKAIIKNWQTNIENCNELVGYRCVGDISSGFYEIFTSSISKSMENLSSIEIYNLILLLSCWIFISTLISYAKRYQQAGSNKTNISNWWHFIYTNRNTITAKNIAFTLILITGAYLSAAAIAAIPGLQEKSANFQEVSAERLKTQIDEMVSPFDKYSVNVTTVEPFNKLNSLLSDSANIVDSKDTTDDKNIIPGNQNNVSNSNAKNNSSTNVNTANKNTNNQLANLTNLNSVNTNGNSPENDEKINKIRLAIDPEINTLVRGFVSDKEASRKRVQESYKELLENVKSQLQGAKTIAVQSYEAGNLERKGNKERVRYFLDLTEWFSRRTTFYSETLNNCTNSIKSMDSNLEEISNSLIPLLENNSFSFQYIRDIDRDYYNSTLNRTFENCPSSITFNADSLPTRPQLGESSYLGPFGFVASWLLRTESLPLALITGLLGFGLLGSACSTFIRERITNKTPSKVEDDLSQGNTHRQLVSDLTGVVIRGVSAAIVVFLAVEGGLAIFSSGSNEPNPYVLLLTCLIASVFSETVWEWAQKELSSRFNGNTLTVKETQEITVKETKQKPRDN